MSADTDWTPDQPLRADATDEQIAARWHHNPTGNASKCTAEVAREFAAVAIREALTKLAMRFLDETPSASEQANIIAKGTGLWILNWADREYPAL